MADRKRPQEPRRWRLTPAPRRGQAAPSASGPPIATAVLAALGRVGARNVLPLAEIREARSEGERLAGAMAMPGDLKDLHPAHAAYVHAQNLVSVLSESLTRMREMKPFFDLIAPAEDLYGRGGPPISPLTHSYFTCWSFFDARAGSAAETIGTTILAIADRIGLPENRGALLRQMQASRMGVFVHEGVAGAEYGHPLLNLRDVWSGDACQAVSSSGYPGRAGELWFARVLPPPLPGRTPAVVFTTPYLLLLPGAREWRACLRRALPTVPDGRTSEAYESFMKFGPTPSYWNDFVFEAYAGHRKEVIFLEGLPDDPRSRPCSAVNGWGSGP